MNTKQEPFSFELSETLYFDKGQEVREMISISLDPEISIQSFNDYVSIRGVIELHGQYAKKEERNKAEHSLDLDEFHSKRFIEKIDENDDGYNQFAHRFPVEISVPKYRILDTNNITVGVEAFDYELPSESQLKIKAMIHIHGILSHQDERVSSEQADEQENATVSHEQKDHMLEDSFAFEVQMKDEEKQASTSNQHQQQLTRPMAQFSADDSRQETNEAIYHDQASTSEEDLSITDDNLSEDQTVDGEVVRNEEGTKHDIDVHTQEQETDADTKAEERDEFNFLATLFQDKDEEQETYSSMRICIVQENDTLETIAERYHVPKLHILKLNRLEDDDLQEGQLLSIPEKKTKKT